MLILISDPFDGSLEGKLAQFGEVTTDKERLGEADIVIDAGLSAETGFVVNPGRSVLADLFGARPTPIPCSALSLTRFEFQDR